MTIRHRSNENGGVSIFIVIFTALLVTIVTASFAQLMVRNQQQASANDLSQSAYDSALAGVEDAKRALVRLQECENDGDDLCADTIRTALNGLSCNSLQDARVATFEDGEVRVGEPEQNQAYTCVKVQLDTPSYRGDGLAPGIPTVIPLKTKAAAQKVRISWFTKEDLDKASSYSGVNVASFPTNSNPVALPQNGDEDGGWPMYAPALMRAQLIQFNKGDLQLDEFNQKGTANARTAFLYPYDAATGSPAQLQFIGDTRRDTTTQNEPQLATCNDNFDEFNGYACRVEILLTPLGGGGTREAYLQLQTYYQQFTSYEVETLGNANEVVELNEVQPIVDSTGRASSLFRRVEANVTLRNDGISLPYPDAALSVEGEFCKNFFITDSGDEYRSRCGSGE